MSTLFIFGDESGTMPLKDSDKPFVTATISVLDQRPELIEGSNNNKKLVEILKHIKATPTAMVVKPYPGYSKAIKEKYNKLNTMARATRLLTGANADYLDQKTLTTGLDSRNSIWCQAMFTAIGRAILNTVNTSAICTVRIILDQKTMRPSMRAFFKDILIQQLCVGTKKYLLNFHHSDSSGNDFLKSRVCFSAESTFFSWSDENEDLEKEFGLRLADRLSRKIYQSQDSKNHEIETLLNQAGYDDCVVDFTKEVAQLSQRVVENFKEKTVVNGDVHKYIN